MQVLELTQRYPPAVGGVETTVYELVAQLRAAGIEARTVTTDMQRAHPFSRLPRHIRHGPDPRRYRALRLAPLPLGLGIVAPGVLGEAVFAKADIVHAHAFGQFPTWAGAAAQRIRGIPLVVTPHFDSGRGRPFSDLYHRAVTWATLRRADRVIVQSGVERDLLRDLNVPPDRLVEIPSGISLDEFAEERMRPSRADVRLLTVGRIDLEQKGLGTLIEAMALLSRETRFQAEIVGDDWGGYAPMLALARRLGVAGQVHFRLSLPRTEVLRALRDADVFVLPSEFESFPRVVLEAMASGLPVVASRVGGVAEMVEPSGAGITVPPGDPAALADAIRQLASDAGLRQRMSVAGRKRATEFSWPTILPRYLKLFEELASRRPGPA